MSLGAILVGIAVIMVTLAYITRPFRHVTVSSDDVTETWIKQYSPAPLLPYAPPSTPQVLDVTEAPSATLPTPTPPHAPTPPRPDSTTQINFCPQCGRKVAPDHRFCPGCGSRLPHEEVEA